MDSLIQDKYQLIEQFRDRPGRQTWLALDVETEQQVVLKRLSFDASLEWSALKRFERESKILENLEHPQIPEFLDSFELDSENGSEFILIQSYIKAKSLTAHIQAGRTFTDSDIKQIALSILDTLSYLHNRRPPVIHRDIKPSNILLGDRSGNHVGKVYLVDFGSVQTPVATGTDTFTIVGSYGYMAPEQFIGRAAPASDLYGLGATLVYLATGQHPADLITEDFDLDWREPVSLAPYLTDWIKRLAEPDLSRRFKSVKDAIEHLENPPAISKKQSLGKKHSLGIVSTLSAPCSLPPWSGLPLRYIATEFWWVGGWTALLLINSWHAILFILWGLPIPPEAFFQLFIPAATVALNLAYRLFLPSSQGYCSAAWVKRGDRLKNAGNKLKALSMYVRSVQARPRNRDGWYSLGQVLCELTRYKEALFAQEKATQLNPSNPSSWIMQGITLNSLQSHEEALDSFDRAIELEPDYSGGWILRGLTLSALKRYEEAVDNYDRFIELTPDDPKIWLERGLVLSTLKRYEKAVDSFDRAIKLKQNDSDVWKRRGNALSKLKRHEEAVDSYDKANRLDPNNSWIWSKRGAVLVTLTRYEDAVVSLDRAIALDPGDSWTWDNRGYALIALKKYKEAIDSYDRSLKLKPGNSWTLKSRKDALEALKRSEAIASDDQAIEQDLHLSRGLTDQGCALNKLKRYQEAMANFDRSIRLDQKYFWAWCNRGYALMELGRYDEALYNFNTALKLNADCYSARQGRSQVLGLLNR